MAEDRRLIVDFKGIEMLAIGDGKIEKFWDAGQLVWYAVDDAGANKIQEAAVTFLDTLRKYGEARLKKG